MGIIQNLMKTNYIETTGIALTQHSRQCKYFLVRKNEAENLKFQLKEGRKEIIKLTEEIKKKTLL